ncbi:ATP-binding protein [Crenothrix polyspora]|uniref:Putative ATP-binding region, ATPase-like protein n=1 Tax=Crenothrix polyspora TaxID=360316 RepID=A0A1R4H3U8_9GAMM|nr:ATP-binding protein [Crenothrix polyspora]SJM90935.1 putative ATP-binding region, ATPase-like protein [Crenothrix polyspora]
MNKIAMKVNQANLVKSLKYSFTNKTNVLNELMQNARRAKATQVVFEFAPETQILRVTDDGCGIDSIATLLTVAESGWDAEVMAIENPFGLGFLSALFACSHITVVSKSGSLCCATADILSFKPVAVKPVLDWDGMTTITLTGVELELERIDSILQNVARGFPVPVILNGKVLDRKHALDSGLMFIDTAIGSVYLSGVDRPDGVHNEFEVYLQGLPVYSSYSYCQHWFSTRHRHVIHLDSARFYARLPDRDKLIDEIDVVARIKAILTAELERHFVDLKAKLPAEDFILFYEMLRHWHLLALLNDVPVVPREALLTINDYPVCNTEIYTDFVSMPDNAMTRAEIEAGEVVSMGDDIATDGAARNLFAWKRGSLVYNGGLDSGHWIHALVRNLKDEPLSLELVDETHAAQFQGDWVWVGVRFCEAYRIRIGDDCVEISDDACYLGSENEETVIVPKSDASGYVLKQISTYRNEHDDFQESAHEADMAAFASFVVANTANDPADALQRLLPVFAGCPSLYDKSFVVNINAEGHVASVVAA